jgi:hypothetical protein
MSTIVDGDGSCIAEISFRPDALIADLISETNSDGVSGLCSVTVTSANVSVGLGRIHGPGDVCAAVPQGISPAGQPHTPALHVSPGGHAIPHPPQFEESVRRLVHVPEQAD